MNPTTTTTDTLILAGYGYDVMVCDDAEANKAALLKHSAMILEVADPASMDAARHQVKQLAAMRNAVEKSRTSVKAPVSGSARRSTPRRPNS